MPNSRYYIHAIQVINDHPLISSELALFLENKAFITQDLPYINEQTIAYGRRRVDVCDFVIMIIGDSYGEVNPSGVSQLHLSYLASKTKEKKMLILLKSASTKARSPQLHNLINIVEQGEGGPQSLYYYQNDKDFIQILSQGYEQIITEVQQQGWHRLDTALGNPILKKEAANDKYTNNAIGKYINTPVFKDSTTKATTSKSTTKVATEPTNKIVPAVMDNKRVESLGTKTKALGSRNKGSRNKKEKTSAPLSEATIEAIINQSLSDEFKLDSVVDQTVLTTDIDETTKVSYNVHAYQGGNLRDVNLTTTVSWRQLLKTLRKMGDNFSTDTMYRCFNDEVAHSAMQSVVKVLPNVHAVSRCMIEPQDFEWLKEQMQLKDWLKPANVYEKNNREIWQLTDKALTDLDEKS